MSQSDLAHRASQILGHQEVRVQQADFTPDFLEREPEDLHFINTCLR